MLIVGRDPQYLHYSIKFGLDLPKAAAILHYCPEFVKPYVTNEPLLISSLVASLCVDLKSGRKFMYDVLGPVIRDRREKIQELGSEFQKPVTTFSIM